MLSIGLSAQYVIWKGIIVIWKYVIVIWKGIIHNFCPQDVMAWLGILMH